MAEPIVRVPVGSGAKRPYKRRPHHPRGDGDRLHLQHGLLRGDDGDAAGPRGLRYRLQPDRGGDPVAWTPSRRIEIVAEEVGIELRIWLKARDAVKFLGRRRKMAGPTGCGLCGIESLIEAMRPPPKVRGNLAFAPAEIMTAIDSLFPSQELNRESHAVHGAGVYDPGRGLVAVREDVGRHNALDKLAARSPASA